MTTNERTRKTIAVFLDFMGLLGSGYESQLRVGFEAACRRLDMNLILVFGRTFDDTSPVDAAHCQVFELFTPAGVDGVILTPGLAGHAGRRRLTAWIEHHSVLPLCCAGFALPGIPSVVLDDRTGFEALIDHLILAHGCRTPAFLGGAPNSPDAELRLAVYRDALNRHGLAFDPRRVANGGFVRHLGERAMLEVLDRGGAPDSVVAANDEMALGAIEALRRRGLRVPRDMPVTGFDDVQMARLNSPPLTTVRQPIERIAETAVDLIAMQLAGKPAPPIVDVATECVIRQSCGCHRPIVAPSRRLVPGSPGEATEFLQAHREHITNGLARILETTFAEPRTTARRLISALQDQLLGREESFEAALDDLLEEVRLDNESHLTVQGAIGQLRDELCDFATPELVALWDTARHRIALANTHSQARQRYVVSEDYERWMGVGEQLAATFDHASLRERLVAALDSVAMRSYLLALFAPESPAELEPYLGTLDGQPIELPPTRYPAELLFPPGFPLRSERRTWVVYPLAFEAQKLGIAFFEHDRSHGYQLLGHQISTALKNARLHQEIMEKTLLHERSVQERLATTKRLQSLSVLAGGVAHDLNNALGPLVALPDVILAELRGLARAEPEAIHNLVGDIENIRSASLRAAQTIKDLLTLGRQGRTSKEPLDLNRVVRMTLTDESLRSAVETGASMRFTLELSRDPLIVLGSEAHLTRALTNLCRNAAEAMQGHGTITVRTALVRIDTSIAGYETIEPGAYVELTVADTGPGIPQGDLGRVFEPFFSKKKVGENSGSGLGLAIVHGVMKEHDGYVDVHSVLNRGTTFALYFPHLSGSPEVRAMSSLPPRGDARILVVDDEPIQLRTARRVLVHLGHDVETMTSGKQAQEYFVRAAATLRSDAVAPAAWRSPFDLIILDLILNEGEDGLRLLEEIRQLFPDQRVIIASGHAPTERAELAVARGVPWLAKPYTADALARAIRAVLTEKGSRSGESPPAGG
ncbi:MAG: substrate-binding domain-containing protein [Polyangiaceae bacterium]|nr:substrate-binding domain-containing protein [Polyangiaceae bacterium]